MLDAVVRLAEENPCRARFLLVPPANLCPVHLSRAAGIVSEHQLPGCVSKRREFTYGREGGGLGFAKFLPKARLGGMVHCLVRHPRAEYSE